MHACLHTDTVCEPNFWKECIMVRLLKMDIVVDIETTQVKMAPLVYASGALIRRRQLGPSYAI